MIDLPPRTPSKKHDEESVASSKRDDSSPVLKKASVTLQLRSSYHGFSPQIERLTIMFYRTFTSGGLYDPPVLHVFHFIDYNS